jgi:hypothetical protein
MTNDGNIKNYDPNKSYKHFWKVKLQQWDYVAYIECECGGNCKGLGTLESAVEFYMDDKDEYFEIELENSDGDTCGVEIHDAGNLMDMVVGAELIKIEEDKNL